MKTRSAVLLIAVLALTAAQAEEGKEITVESMAPSVVKTVPVCGDMKVDPDLKEITVTFSKDMMTDRMWSVCQISKEHYPKSRGDVHYKDDRTFVFPVKLEPGKTYVMWFNRAQYNSFRDTGNRPAVPYQLVFKTKDK
jgi:RNA polymerase sigma-70 factor (ECF subfamily)